MKKNLTIETLLAGAALFATSSAFALNFDANVTSNVIMGSGIGNGSFTVDQANGVELGLRGKTRFPTPDGTYNSNHNGTYSFANTLPTAVWSFEWSINSNYNGNSGWNLSGLTYALRIDSDPTQATSFGIFDPINAGGWWDHSIGTNATAQSAGVEATDAFGYMGLIGSKNLAQNSWQAAWFLTNFDPTLNATYDFELAAFDGSTKLAETRMQIIVGTGGAAVPDAGSTLMLLGVAFAGLAGYASHKR